MFTKTENTNQTNLEETINVALSELRGHEADSDEYAKITEQLEKLYKMKVSDKDDPILSLDKLIPVIGNLAGIFAILNYERMNVVATKALGFVVKSKI